MVKFLKKTWWAPLVILLIVGVAFGATHERFTTGNPEYKNHANEVFVISNRCDFGDLRTTGPAGVILSGVTKGDTVQLLDIPAGTYVMAVGFEIITATTDSGITVANVLIGDNADNDGWLSSGVSVTWGATASGVSISSGGSTYVTPTGGTAQSFYVAGGAYGHTGKYYSSGATIAAVIPSYGSQKATSALSDFVVQPFAICIKPSSQKAYTKP
jgi:hypothetical protein